MTKIYVVTDGDTDFSTCIGVYLTQQEAEERAKEYSNAYEYTNVSIAATQINL